MPDTTADLRPGEMIDDAPEQSLVLSHVVHTIRRYIHVIALAMAAAAIGYAILAVFLYLRSSSRQVTTMQFRLDFTGAASGLYPNGLKFSPADITAAPIMLDVYNKNNVGQFMPFTAFNESIFVLESNAAYERLAADYQSKLSDPRLTLIERSRLEAEFEQKRGTILKSEYSINYLRPAAGGMPQSMVAKALNEILSTWANRAAVEKGVLSFQASVLSPNILDDEVLNDSDAIVGVTLLRNKIADVLKNAEMISKMPGASLIRTSKEHMSLDEVQLALGDVLRYQIEPLSIVARGAGHVKDPATAIQVLQAQLAYDQRRLSELRMRADTLRNALALYESSPQEVSDRGTAVLPSPQPTERGKGGETVIVNDTVLDRILALSGSSADREYRQRLIEDIKSAALSIIPAETAVAYDTEVLNAIRAGSFGTYDNAAGEAIRARLRQAHAEVAQAIRRVNEIYTIGSRQLYPATELYSRISPPVTRVERGASLMRLGLGGILFLLVCLPIIVAACLLHNKLQEEEAIERHESVAAAV